MEPCTKSREIEIISDRVERIEENIDGNGKPGMKAELVEIKTEQRHMNQFLSDLNTNVSALVKFMNDTQTVTRIKLQVRDVVNMIITAVLSASAIAVALIVT